MRRSPLYMATIYFILGAVFIFFAVQNVTRSGWDFFTYFLVILATLDIGSGIRFIGIHRKIKQMKNEQQPKSK
ncbi:hypothetical protein AC622_18710 [Bacillus sp. FJAT-27916]|uniref:YdiK family protein n=1 Tax=Bacillaceae TaxID=186817 RepID=UPI000671234A|nr:YdiK family protein [Bacillus sp. FJAT-27916]KMY45980.1 hypothetical protein AC622_18710 [Bacillus sp. FJAT-27916]